MSPESTPIMDNTMDVDDKLNTDSTIKIVKVEIYQLDGKPFWGVLPDSVIQSIW